MTIAEVAVAAQGAIHGVDPSTVVHDVVIDSREASPGSLFVAIAGEHVDGHDFSSAAVAAGAVAVLAARDTGGPCVVVDDTTLALGRIAAAARTRLRCEVIAITGSSGKTSTKDLLAQVLSAEGPTVAATGSNNNEIGCPLTILRADERTRFLVLEMGMRGEGHIAYLCEIARPTAAALINIGSAHLGVVGSREGIARAKGEILDTLPDSGVAVLYGDDPVVLHEAARTRARVVTFGETTSCPVRATDVRVDALARPSFTLHIDDTAEPVSLQLHGEHNVLNALAVAAVASELGLDIEQIAMGLRAATAQSRWRMEVHEAPGGITVINDAYNANPESMRAALRALRSMSAGRRTWAVLGEMRELGDRSVEEHDAIGRLAVRLDISRLVCVGPATRVMHLGAANEGSWSDESMHVADADEAIAVLRRELAPGDVVLVKASRSVGLERVADALMEEGPA